MLTSQAGINMKLLMLTVRIHTTQNSWNKWTKILSPENGIFQLKNDGEKWSRIYFEIDRAPSEIPANLPGQSGEIFFALGSSNSEASTISN